MLSMPIGREVNPSAPADPAVVPDFWLTNGHPHQLSDDPAYYSQLDLPSANHLTTEMPTADDNGFARGLHWN
jgi:hypothetical protein